MSLSDWLIVGAVILLLIAAIGYIIKQKKKGKCIGCSGDCQNCCSGMCESKKKG